MLVAVACVFGLVACSGTGEAKPQAVRTAVPEVVDPGSETSASHTPAADGQPGTPAPSKVPPVAGQDSPASQTSADLTGFTVALDPGHNGGNGSHSREINRPVPNGRGGTKACNTTGTATNDGFAEHEFNWEVTTRLRTKLEDMGTTVIMSRDSDNGVGPCVDERGTFADDADLLVSVHANGSTDTSIKGFGVIVAPTEAQSESTALAKHLVTGLSDAGFPINTRGYGTDGINVRTDLAGLNNASVPAVIVECGEMRNAAEATVMESAHGQDSYADALTRGIVAYLLEGSGEAGD